MNLIEFYNRNLVFFLIKLMLWKKETKINVKRTPIDDTWFYI